MTSDVHDMHERGQEAGLAGEPWRLPTRDQFPTAFDAEQMIDAWRQGYRIGRNRRLAMIRSRLMPLSQRATQGWEIEAICATIRREAETWASMLPIDASGPGGRMRSVSEQHLVREVLLEAAAAVERGDHRCTPVGDREGAASFLGHLGRDWRDRGNPRLANALLKLSKAVWMGVHLKLAS